MRYVAAACLLLGPCSCLAADLPGDALGQLVAKSEYIVAGEITADPAAEVGEAGTAGYKVELKVTALLKNRPPKEANAVPAGPRKDDTQRLTITRVEFPDEDKLPYLKKGSRCIFFLKYKLSKEQEGWAAPEGLADVWLGVQPYTPSLARAVTDLDKAKGSGSKPK